MCRVDSEPSTRATVIAGLILLALGVCLVVGVVALAQLLRVVLRV